MFLYWSVLLGISEEDTEDLLIKLKNDKKFHGVVNAWGGRFNIQKNLLTNWKNGSYLTYRHNRDECKLLYLVFLKKGSRYRMGKINLYNACEKKMLVSVSQQWEAAAIEIIKSQIQSVLAEITATLYHANLTHPDSQDAVTGMKLGDHLRPSFLSLYTHVVTEARAQVLAIFIPRGRAITKVQ